MSTLGPLLPSTFVGYDAGYSWQSRTVAESSLYHAVHSPGRVFRNGDIFHGARLGGFSFFASLSRYALTCICKMFGVPNLLIPEPMEHLISFCELLVRTYLSTSMASPFIRRHYYYLNCDALNRCRWRAVVNETFPLPLSFTSLVGFRARLEYYPRSLFLMRDEFVTFYCSFLRGFMCLLSDRMARASGLMGSCYDDSLLTASRLAYLMAERARFYHIARTSLSNSPFVWAPDVFDGLRAHSSLLWYRREAPVLNLFGTCAFVPSIAESRLLGRVLDRMCRRFRGPILSFLLGELSDYFYGFREYSDRFDDYTYRLVLPRAIESIVLRSGMLSFVDCPAFIHWLGACLPVVGLSSGVFRTPSRFVGAYVPMINFGEGGHVACLEYDGGGSVVPMEIAVGDQYCLHNGNHILYNGRRPYDEVMDLNNVYSGDPVFLRAEDMDVPYPN